MLRKAFLLSVIAFALAFVMNGWHAANLPAEEAAPQAQAEVVQPSAPESLPASEVEHRKLEMLIEEFKSLPGLWPDHYRPPKVFDARKAELDSLGKRLAEVNFKALDNYDWVQWYLMREQLGESAKAIQDWKEQTERVAKFAPSSRILYDLRMRLFEMDDPECMALMEELAAVPDKITEAQGKIKESTPGDLGLVMRWLERDGRIIEEWSKLQGGTVPDFVKTYGEACQKALDAVRGYREWLEKSRKEWPKDPERKRLGEEEFAKILRQECLELRPPKELEQLGWDQLKSTKAEMEALAKEIDPDKTLQQIFDGMKDAHPQVGQTAASYQQVVDRAKEFLQKKDIITLPDECLTDVRVERYVDRDNRMPYAFYQPFGEDQDRFMSSEPLLDQKPNEIADKLTGHNFYSMFPVTVHETFPGHHVMFAHMAANHRVPRVDYSSAFTMEGWGLYCEQMMYEQGFYAKENEPKGWDLDPRMIRLTQLRWRVHRAVRVIIDVGFQTENMSYDDAVKMMVNEAGAEESNARAEVNRFMDMPTQPMSYLIGYLDIMKLREDYKKMKGDKFSLKEFHDELMSYATAPLILVRAAMLGERDKVDEMLQK